MKKRFFTFLLIFLFICTLASVLPIHNEREIYENTIRLHIIANSNSQEDQLTKLFVRDKLVSSSLVDAGPTKRETENSIATKKDAILVLAETALQEKGVAYGARVEWGYEYYPTKEYEGVIFPAGKYRSLRLVLGDGTGENWWCVMFPSLCDDTYTADLKVKDGEILPANEKRFTIRLKILEWFSFYD